MNLFFKNKIADHDFEEDKLPSTRSEVFFDALRLRFATFIKAGLVLLLFLIPLIVTGFIKDSYYFTVYESFVRGEITEENYSGIASIVELIYCGVKIICLIIFGVGLSGVLRVIRQIIWGEPVFFGQDIFDGIRMQGLRYAIYFFFAGLFDLLARTAMVFGFSTELLKYLPLVLNYCLFLPPLLYALFEAQIYDFRLLNEYQNGFIMYLKTFPKTILVTVIVCLPQLFDLIELLILKYALIIVYAVAVLPFLLMGVFLFFTSVFDKYINIERYPDIYDKGIRRKETNANDRF